MKERLRFERELTDLELESKAASGDRKPPIIFVPGVMGSELERGSATVWPTRDPATAKSLKLDKEGKDIGDTVVAKRVWRKVPAPWILLKLDFFRLFDVYGEFFEFFKKKGFSESHESKNLFEFPYDWRKDLVANAESLQKLIQSTYDKDKVKVILIAHSLGGLVARRAMVLPSIQQMVEKFIILGTPHHGAPKYLSTLLFGKEWPASLLVNLSVQDTRQLVSNFPSLYQGTMDFTSPFTLLFNNGKPVRPEELKTLFPSLINESMIESSTRFHKDLNDSWDRFPFYNTFLIVSGGDVETISSILMKNGNHEDYGRGRGDGTIPEFSSAQIESGTPHTHIENIDDVSHHKLATTTKVLQSVLAMINQSIGYEGNPGPIPVWEFRNPSQEQGSGPLQKGDKRTAHVSHLQAALAKLGFTSSDPSGSFGESTTNAVKKFQGENKDVKGAPLVADGLVGPLTADSINRALIGEWYYLVDYFTPRILCSYYGQLKGGISLPGFPAEYTLWVQIVLKTAFNQTFLKIDGIFGPETRKAVRLFQDEYGLIVDGVVGPQTETALIQVALNEVNRRNNDPKRLNVNGVLDEETKQEIIRFQSRSDDNLVPDGIVGPKTRASMFKVLNRKV